MSCACHWIFIPTETSHSWMMSDSFLCVIYQSYSTENQWNETNPHIIRSWNLNGSRVESVIMFFDAVLFVLYLEGLLLVSAVFISMKVFMETPAFVLSGSPSFSLDLQSCCFVFDTSEVKTVCKWNRCSTYADLIPANYSFCKQSFKAKRCENCWIPKSFCSFSWIFDAE